jgi:concentrative nucleoside transporter, CNT family
VFVERATSLLGVACILALAFAACPKDRRRQIRLRTVGLSVALVFVLSLVLLRTPVRNAFGVASLLFDKLLGFSRDGAIFVFGSLVSDPKSFGFIFAFQVLPTILFFSAMASVLYHVRVLPWVIDRTGRVLMSTLGTSGPESFSTVSDIFVGQSEAPLVIKPYLDKMTLSELHACMVAGFATTAGGVMAAYVAMLSDQVPGIAGHLIACSVLGAPASLAIAKLSMPESESPLESNAPTEIQAAPSQNLLDAIARGTMDGLKLAVNVGAMLIVFLAFVAMLNAGIAFVGDGFGVSLSLERLLGWLFAPLAFLTGVPHSDVLALGTLLGQKTALNEFVAYSHMSEMLAKDPTWLSERGRIIASYALCGFANFSSIGIQIGSYSSLAPGRRADFSKIAFRAMCGGTLATTLVACVVGIFA